MSGEKREQGQREPKSKLRDARILVAEDNVEIKELMAVILSSEGAHFEFAETGPEALQKALSQPFDVILMDLTLPELTGEEVVKKIRQEGLQTPIIAFSAYSEDQRKSNCLAIGFNDYITKPFDIDTLSKKVERYLKRKTNPTKHWVDSRTRGRTSEKNKRPQFQPPTRHN